MENIVARGLTQEKASQKLKAFGKNEIDIKESFSVLHLFFSQFPTVINAILFVAAIFSFIVKDFIDAFFIIAILILNAIFGFLQEFKAEKSLEKLKKYYQTFSRVIRDGKEIKIQTSEIVPGDLVVLSEGERIPADGKLVDTRYIEIDESVLTGESIPIVKKDKEEAFAGTFVLKGKGFLLIEKTGTNTKFGEIAKTLAKMEEDKTPLENKLDSLGKVLSAIAIIVSLSLIPIGLIQGSMLLPLIILAISIGVAAIPESLPAIVTIALSIGTNRMAKKNAIVRKMDAIETLGAVQVVLIDKTGTLTQNIMRVKKIWFTSNKTNLNFLYKACVLGNTANLVKKEKEWDIVGDKTDGALLLWAKEEVRDLDALKNSGKIVDEFSFDPQTKTVTTVFEDQGKKFVYVKGAPEEIMKKLKTNVNEKEKIKDIFESYAKDGLRVIAFATKEAKPKDSSREHYEKDLEFIGLVGIYDPPREEVKKAVKDAKNAGIHTVMVTGDNELTALAIAREIGLIEENEDVLTGEELEKIKDEELEKIIFKTRIFARTKPEDKLRLATLFKKLGYVVGVTGDGVNDALALKKADIGIAMGEKGTDVAKDASDIILTDDNFSTLVKAIEEGRIIYNNIVKAVTYLISGNISELSLIFFAFIFGFPSPLLPTQILWINLITDGVPALALASDNKEKGLLSLKPRNPKQAILSNGRLVFILTVGLGLASFLFLTYIFLLNTVTEIQARTIVFNLLVFMHMGIAFIVRGKSMFKMNRFLVLGVILTILLQILITTLPFFQSIFHLKF